MNSGLHPTRVDVTLEPSEAMQTVDFFIPDEPEIFAAWAAMRVKREAADAQLTGFSEVITLEGSSASIKRISHKTRRVMEHQQRLFRFAINHEIDSVPKVLAPMQVEAMYDPGPDRIREANAAARAAGVNNGVKHISQERQRFPWLYVSGLVSAVALLTVAKVLHLT